MALALAVTACVPNMASTPLSPVLTASPDVTGASGSSMARTFSLLANNHLLVADPSSGIVIAELRLAGPAAAAGQRRALALSRDGGSLFALVSEAEAGAVLAVVDIAGLKVSASFDLDRKLSYRGIAVGPRTGRVYLFANQDGDALVQVLDPRDGGITEWLARRSDGRNWFVYQGGVTADENALFLSYHGIRPASIGSRSDRAASLVAAFPLCPVQGAFARTAHSRSSRTNSLRLRGSHL